MANYSWVVPLLSSIISGLVVGVTVACVISCLDRRRAKRALRQDVLRRLLGYSYRLTEALKGTIAVPQTSE